MTVLHNHTLSYTLYMRQAMTISLPATLTKTVSRAVRSGRFATTSEFFRSLIRRWEEDEKLSKMIQQSEQEFALGKGKTLRSLRDLRS